jgi:lysophospholipase L1-like esterase
MGGPRTDLAYPRATEAELLAAGRVAEVRDTSLASERVKTALKRWQREVFNFSPDVVVLNYGHFESIHLFLPQPLERHANSLQSRPGPVRDAYRRILLRPLWMSLARLQQRLDRALPSTIFSHRPRRVANDLERLVQRTQMIQSPLVLILELTPPGERFLKWFPGIGERMEVMNQTLAEVVRRIDKPNVRFFSTSAALAELSAAGHDLVPDGGHYTPVAHRAIATALAREILAWADQQPHLNAGTQPGVDGARHEPIRAEAT